MHPGRLFNPAVETGGTGGGHAEVDAVGGVAGWVGGRVGGVAGWVGGWVGGVAGLPGCLACLGLSRASHS